MLSRVALSVFFGSMAVYGPEAFGAQQPCPKLLMFDGVDIQTQTNDEQARYWGKTIGIQGFFLNNIMPVWQADVGRDSGSKIWRLARRFQRVYSDFGVTDNFIKVAIWNRHSWYDATANRQLVSNFTHAARLANYAGMKGIAIDMEPYVPTWGGSGGGSELAQAIEEEGRSIGTAIHGAYPEMTLVLIQDALYWASRREGYHGGYALAVPFLRGLLSIRFKSVIIAGEQSYVTSPSVAQVAGDIQREYGQFIAVNGLPRTQLSASLGLWPLGTNYQNKSAQISPEVFFQQLRSAYSVSSSYVWIYGFGSAWQTDGPYGKGPVVSNFEDYVRAVKQIEVSCVARK